MVLQALDYEVINLSWNQYMKYFRVCDECFGLYLFAGNALGENTLESELDQYVKFIPNISL